MTASWIECTLIREQEHKYVPRESYYKAYGSCTWRLLHLHTRWPTFARHEPHCESAHLNPGFRQDRHLGGAAAAPAHRQGPQAPPPVGALRCCRPAQAQGWPLLHPARRLALMRGAINCLLMRIIQAAPAHMPRNLRGRFVPGRPCIELLVQAHRATDVLACLRPRCRRSSFMRRRPHSRRRATSVGEGGTPSRASRSARLSAPSTAPRLQRSP